MKAFVYHCVLLPACPFEVVDAVPFAVSLAEAGVICRPPATLVYAGSTQCQYMKHTDEGYTVHLQMSLCELIFSEDSSVDNSRTFLRVCESCTCTKEI